MNPVAPRDVWADALRAAWMLAKGERRQALTGQHARSFDARGLHPYSYAWGQIAGAEDVDPGLGDERDTGRAWLVIGQEPVGLGPLDAVSLRNRAHRAAEADFVADVRERAEQVWAT